MDQPGQGCERDGERKKDRERHRLSRQKVGEVEAKDRKESLKKIEIKVYLVSHTIPAQYKPLNFA